MTTDSLTELAELFKDRNPKPAQTMTTGIVLSLPPNPKIKLNDDNILFKDNLVFAESIANDLHLTGKEVILMPVSRNLYYVLDKAVRF